MREKVEGLWLSWSLRADLCSLALKFVGFLLFSSSRTLVNFTSGIQGPNKNEDPCRSTILVMMADICHMARTMPMWLPKITWGFWGVCFLFLPLQNSFIHIQIKGLILSLWLIHSFHLQICWQLPCHCTSQVVKQLISGSYWSLIEEWIWSARLHRTKLLQNFYFQTLGSFFYLCPKSY